MIKRFFELIRRGWRKPPHVIVRWLVRQARAEWDQPPGTGPRPGVELGRVA
tara:strand:+ start:4044 stop:4196 length:153 start_codon:yes stop_codon:yes gene_type:complete